MDVSIKQKREKTAKLLRLKTEQLPRHIAIIMDGNGRWARQKRLPRFEGHREGAKTVEKIVKCCVDLGIECLSLFLLPILALLPKLRIHLPVHIMRGYVLFWAEVTASPVEIPIEWIEHTYLVEILSTIRLSHA